MKTSGHLISILIVLALLIALTIGAYLFFQDIYRLLISLDQQTTAIVAGVLIGSLLIAMSIRWAGKMSGARRLGMEKRADIYRQLIQKCSESLVRSNPGSATHRLSENRYAVEHQLALWASTAVLKQYVALRRMDPQISINDPAKRLVVEKMMREMRRDLGRHNLGLGDSDLTDLLL